MLTSTIITKIKALQATLSALSLFNINSHLYPLDTTPSDGCCYDYVVVGGGNAGSVVSARLVEAGYSVLLLEAGELYNVASNFPGYATFVKNSPADWNYTAEPDGFTGNCHTSSGLLVPRVLGGASSVDFMIYSRGNPSDYFKWYKITNDATWKWKNMFKYFRKGENLRDQTILNSPYSNYHGINGKVNITRDPNDVCDEYIKGFVSGGEPAPLDNVGNASLGYARALYYIDKGTRINAAYAYLTPLINNYRLHISLNSLATKIIFDEQKNAVGVEFVKNGIKINVKARKEVIVSAGPIKSPQLLMLSGIGRKGELNKWNITSLSNVPVGRNLQNIIGAFLVFKTNKTAKPEPFDSNKFLSPLVTGYSAIDKSSRYPDYATLNFIIDSQNFFLSFCGFTLTFENEICDRLYVEANNTQLMATVLLNLQVKSRGKVYLRSTNPEDSPKILTNYYSNDKDLDAVAKEIQHYMKVVSSPYFKGIGLKLMDATNKCNHLKEGSKEYWRCYALCMTAGTGRLVGTNSMGTVVDSEFRVYGVNKLRVVDASVIPTTISGETFAAIVALAEKAAEIIILSK